MSRSLQILLAEILAAIGLVKQYMHGIDQVAFFGDTEKQDAVLRRLEIIGEAVKGLSVEFRNAHPRVPWRDIAGARDVLIHEYFRVDLDMAWEMVQRDLPILEAEVREIIRSLE